MMINVCVDKLRRLLLDHKPASDLYAARIQPQIIKDVHEQLHQMSETANGEYFLVELPWLNDMSHVCQSFIANATAIISVECPDWILKNRISNRNPNLTQAEIERFLQSQMTDAGRRTFAGLNFNSVEMITLPTDCEIGFNERITNAHERILRKI